MPESAADNALDEHSAAQLSTSLAAGSTTAVQIAQHYLDRIEKLNPSLNAVLAVATESALAAAAESDARRAQGRVLGPLDGVPILIKDNIEAIGLPGTAGSRALLGSAPEADSEIVSRIRSAGLVLLGATNLSEWANFRSTASTSGWSAVGGQTRNPYHRQRNTSGSSSGSAAAAAAGLAPLTVGTETDGSIVSPAGICGVVGFKPTHGTVAGAGIVPISARQDTAGPITRNVADAAALYRVLSGREFDLRPLPLAGRAISVWRPAGVDPATAAVLDEVVEALRGAGCELRSGSAQPSGPFSDDEFTALVAEFAVELPAYLSRRRGPHPATWAELLAFNRADPHELSHFGDEIFSLAQSAPTAESTDYLQARSRADAGAGAELETALAGCEFAVTLTNAPAWPIRYGTVEDDHIATSTPSAVTGAPSLTIPAGVVDSSVESSDGAPVDGLPIGITILARRGNDAGLLGLGLALEQLLPPRVDPALS